MSPATADEPARLSDGAASPARLAGIDRRAWLLAAPVVIVGIVLRLHYLNVRGSLWLDELFTVSAATRPSIPGVLAELVTDPHPPAFVLFMHGWLGLVGVTSEAIVRFPSVLAAAAMLLLVAGVAGRVIGDRTALVWLALLAASPMAVAFSAEARPYAFLLLAQTAVLLASLGLRDAPRSRSRWGLLMVAALLSSSIHYYGALVSAIDAAAFGLVAYRDRRDRGELARWAGVGIAACLPAGAWALATMAGGGGPFTLTGWLKPPASGTIVRDVLAVFGDRARDLIVVAVLVVLGLGSALLARARRQARRPAPGPSIRTATPVVVPLGIVIVTTFAFALVVSWIHPIWDGRYFIELIPYALLVVAISADRAASAVRAGWPRAALVGGIVVLVLAVGATTKLREPAREDWREAATETLARYQGPGTLVVAYGPATYELDRFWAIYTASILPHGGRTIPAAELVQADAAALGSLDLHGHPQVIWLSGHFPMTDQAATMSAAAGMSCIRIDFVKATILDCRRSS